MISRSKSSVVRKDSGSWNVRADHHRRQLAKPSARAPVLAQNCGNIENAAIFSSRPHTLGGHGYDPVRSHLRPLVPFSKPSVTGARAGRIATSGDRLAPATPSPTSAPFRRPAPVGVALPGAAAGPRNLGTRQTRDCGPVASQRLSDLLAMAITRSGTAQDERRNTRPDPSNEPRQPALGRTSCPRRTPQARHRGQSGHRWKVSASAPEGSLPDLAQLFAEPYDSHRRGRHVRRRDRDV
jgi:hypothetical protein